MTQQFHEGQEVEVHYYITQEAYAGFAERRRWRRAKIVARQRDESGEELLHPSYFPVQFPDGTRAVFDAANIRAVSP